MSMFFKKKKTNRQVFGFLCDRHLALRVKMLAGALEVPIYPLAEHLLQLGLAHILDEVSSNPDNAEMVKEELSEHLVREHLLVEKLANEDYEHLFIARHEELTPQQQREVNAVINLVKRLEDRGLTRDTVLELVEELIISHERQRKLQQIRQELQRDIDLRVLREINQRFPRLIPALQKLMARYPAEELAHVLYHP